MRRRERDDALRRIEARLSDLVTAFQNLRAHLEEQAKPKRPKPLKRRIETKKR